MSPSRHGRHTSSETPLQKRNSTSISYGRYLWPWLAENYVSGRIVFSEKKSGFNKCPQQQSAIVLGKQGSSYPLPYLLTSSAWCWRNWDTETEHTDMTFDNDNLTVCSPDTTAPDQTWKKRLRMMLIIRQTPMIVRLQHLRRHFKR